MNLFYVRPLDEYLQGLEQSLRNEVRQEADDRILSVDIQQLFLYFVNRYSVASPNIDTDAATSTIAEVMVRASDFPHDRGFFVHEGKSYPKTQVTVHVPFSGDRQILERQPSSHMLWTHDVHVAATEISFSVMVWDDRDGAAGANREIADILNHIKRQAANVERELQAYNASLPSKVERIVTERREAVLKRRNLADALVVPVRRAPPETVPRAFSVPITKRPLIARPESTTQAYKPEPALDDAVYKDILRLIHDFGVTMERLPSLYAGKDEEALRDHLLLILAPHFQSATGETFNKSGKTDILIRQDKHNVFVAECKFWKGAQSLSDTVDQVLKYLTWRDSKVAVIMFVKNKDIAAVVEQVPAVMTKHPCHVNTKGLQAEGWFSFAFHLPGDPSRGLALSVQCFHFPSAD